VGEPRDDGGGPLVLRPEVLPPDGVGRPDAGDPFAPTTPLPPPLAHRPHWGLAALLAAATLFTTTTLGAVYLLWAHPTRISPIDWPFLLPSTIAGVWGDPEILRLGLSFSLPALAILLAHEMGHYLACRWYRLPSTVPYFLPLPAALGTLGAFIRIRAPIRDRRQLFDVGVAGPLAGFAVLVPFLLVGVARSEVVVPPPLAAGGEMAGVLLVPGRCLAIEAATLAFHGPLPEGAILHLHPFALAAWFGLLITAMNLLPVGQLDGGHVLYAVAPRLQHRLALPIWLAIAAAAFLFPGWLLWCLILLLIGLRHPPVMRPGLGLGRGRWALAALALVVLAVSFMPVPISDVLVGL
jgi:membrane-associated protease RseP (regulator of RpoE activity)